MNQTIALNPNEQFQKTSLTLDDAHPGELWESTLQKAFELANPSERTSFPPEEWLLSEVAWPMVENEAKAVLSCFHELVNDELLAREKAAEIYGDLITPLWKSIFETVSRSMVVELAAAKQTGLLPGETEIERYDFFIDCLKDPEFSLSLIKQRPPLCELLVAICQNWKTATKLFLTRLHSDFSEISEILFRNKAIDAISGISPSQGDTHRFGQSVVLLELDTGEKFLYKPRSVATEVCFYSFANWLNEEAEERVIKPVFAIDKQEYGWCQFVEQQSVKSKPGLRRYHERLGILLAVSRVLRVTDLHTENIIAEGEWPVLIDLETMFHPLESSLRPPKGLSPSEWKMSDILSKSVQSTGLLPTRSLNELATQDSLDLAGMADTEGKKIPFDIPAWEKVGTDEMKLRQISHSLEGNKNMPVYAGKRILPGDYKKDVMRGFCKGYTILACRKRHLASIDGPLKNFFNNKIRVVLRATQFYVQLIADGSHPELLIDFDAKTKWLMNILNNEESSEIERRLSAPELAAFLRNDVPYFESSPLSRDITDCSGQVHTKVLPASGWDCTRKIIEGLDDPDLGFQLWLIDVSLSEHQESRISMDLVVDNYAAGSCDQKKLAQNVAEAAAREVCNFATHKSGHASWLTLKETPGGTLCMTPAALDLYSGLPGIALFLGKAGGALQNTKYKAVGKAALNHILFKIDNGEAKDLSCGGYSGTGGLIFALSHLISDYPDVPIPNAISKLVGMVSSTSLSDSSLELVDGLAGLILSLASSIAQLQKLGPQTETLATDMTTVLSKTCNAIRNRVVSDHDVTLQFHNSNGMAHGMLGLKAALSAMRDFQHADIQNSATEVLSMLNEHNITAKHTKVCCGTSKSSIAWCRGMCGDLLGELMIDGDINQSILSEVFHSLLRGHFSDDSLCHGSMGVLHALHKEKHRLSADRQNELDDVTQLTLERICRNKPLSGTIGHAFSPGFMDGFSGIGFAALSIIEPVAIPTALSLGTKLCGGLR